MDIFASPLTYRLPAERKSQEVPYQLRPPFGDPPEGLRCVSHGDRSPWETHRCIAGPAPLPHWHCWPGSRCMRAQRQPSLSQRWTEGGVPGVSGSRSQNTRAYLRTAALRVHLGREPPDPDAATALGSGSAWMHARGRRGKKAIDAPGPVWYKRGVFPDLSARRRGSAGDGLAWGHGRGESRRL